MSRNPHYNFKVKSSLGLSLYILFWAVASIPTVIGPIILGALVIKTFMEACEFDRSTYIPSVKKEPKPLKEQEFIQVVERGNGWVIYEGGIFALTEELK